MRRPWWLFVAVCAPALADPGATATGVFDFELASAGTGYVLRDGAYTVTFPSKPTVNQTTFPFQGTSYPAMAALVDDGDEGFTFGVKPMPKSWWGSSAKALESARDGMLDGSQTKLVKETATSRAGLDGRHIRSTRTVDAKTIYLDADLLWDRAHRSVIIVGTVNATGTANAAERAFTGSFVVHRDARGPNDEPVLGDGSSATVHAPDLVVSRNGSAYTLHDGAMEVTFDDRPTVTAEPLGAVTVISAVVSRAEIESVAFIMMSVPDGQQIDPARALAGGRDGILKQFSHEQHTERAAKVGGLDGRLVEVTGDEEGIPDHAEIRMAWDPAKRRIYVEVASTAEKQLPVSARAFLDSFATHRAK
jgi:hypothetical protein